MGKYEDVFEDLVRYGIIDVDEIDEMTEKEFKKSIMEKDNKKSINANLLTILTDIAKEKGVVKEPMVEVKPKEIVKMEKEILKEKQKVKDLEEQLKEIRKQFKRKKITKSTVKSIENRRKKGETIQQIADELGRSYWSVYNIWRYKIKKVKR